MYAHTAGSPPLSKVATPTSLVHAESQDDFPTSVPQTRSQPFVAFQRQASLTSQTGPVMIYPTDHRFLPCLPFPPRMPCPTSSTYTISAQQEPTHPSGHGSHAATSKDSSPIALLPSPSRRGFLASESTSSGLLLWGLFSILKLIRGVLYLPLLEYEFLKTKLSVSLFSSRSPTPHPWDLAQLLAPARFWC